MAEIKQMKSLNGYEIVDEQARERLQTLEEIGGSGTQLYKQEIHVWVDNGSEEYPIIPVHFQLFCITTDNIQFESFYDAIYAAIEGGFRGSIILHHPH